MGKKYNEVLKNNDFDSRYSAADALELVKKTSVATFDATINIVFNLNIDTRHADQQIRGALVLPHGTGKSQKILVVAEGADATAAAAELSKTDKVVSKPEIDEVVKDANFDYDVIIATPTMMPALGRYGKILGPKGLMPNPKVGTVTTDLVKAIQEIKKGKITYRADKDGNLHTILGKVSFSKNNLLDNYQVLLETVTKSRPNVVKGNFIKNIVVSATMSPGVKIKFN